MHPKTTHSSNNTVGTVLSAIREIPVWKISRGRTASRSTVPETAQSLGKNNDRRLRGSPERRTKRKIRSVRDPVHFVTTTVRGRLDEDLLDLLEILDDHNIALTLLALSLRRYESLCTRC